jgi:excinuclease UvrABC nuclease subunit
MGHTDNALLARYAGVLAEDDCVFPGPGVVYLYACGEDAPVYIGRAANLRHAIRWQRYQLSRQNGPGTNEVRWEAVATASELEAVSLEQNELRRLRPRLNVGAIERTGALEAA